jgi:ribosomal protein S27AE
MSSNIAKILVSTFLGMVGGEKYLERELGIKHNKCTKCGTEFIADRAGHCLCGKCFEKRK